MNSSKTKTSMNYGIKKNKLLLEKMRDLEGRSRHNNLRVDGLKETENKTWEQTEGILLQMIRDVLELEGLMIKTTKGIHQEQ